MGLGKVKCFVSAVGHDGSTTSSLRLTTTSSAEMLQKRNNSPTTLVALATYNEIENLPTLADAILDTLPEADLLVVDDNSPDGTGQWCAERAALEPRFHCIHRAGKMGLGTAAIEAIRFALEKKYHQLATLDADWSHAPKYLPDLLAPLQQTDVAIGSRYCPGGQIEGWPLHRRILSRVLNRVSCRLLRLPVQDASGSFRAYRVERLQQLPLEKFDAIGYAYLEEILWHLDQLGATFTEVPILFSERRAGRSKINSREAVEKLTTIWRLRNRS